MSVGLWRREVGWGSGEKVRALEDEVFQTRDVDGEEGHS